MPAPQLSTTTWRLIGAACAAVAAALIALGASVLAANPEETTTVPDTTATTEATTTTSTTEPTTGTTQTPTTSGGPFTVPATCRPEATNAGAQLRQDFPTDESTGPSGLGLDEDRLPPSGKPSTWKITTPNTVVEGVYHHGRIVVAASGVKITGSVVCGTGANIVQVEDAGKGLVIEDSTIVGERGTVMANAGAGQPCEAAVGYGGFTLERSEVQGCVDGLKVSGRTRVVDSYFHDNYANRGGDNGTHNDTVQYQATTSALSDFTFQGNASYQDPCTSNRHFQMAPTSGGSGGVWRISGNLFYGIHLINVDRGVRVADGTMTDNVLAGGRTRGPDEPPYYAGDGIGTVHRSGNRFEDGSSVDDNPGVAYSCVAG